MNRALLLAALPLLAFSTSGCGTEVDESAWRSDVEGAIGHEVADWGSYVELTEGWCAKSREGFQMYVAVADDEGHPREALEADVRHACPDRAAELLEVYSIIRD